MVGGGRLFCLMTLRGQLSGRMYRTRLWLYTRSEKLYREPKKSGQFVDTFLERFPLTQFLCGCQRDFGSACRKRKLLVKKLSKFPSAQSMSINVYAGVREVIGSPHWTLFATFYGRQPGKFRKTLHAESPV